MPVHKISVTVDSNAIRVEPNTLVMTSVDEVHWAGTNARQFSIAFDNDGPFGQKELPHAHAITRRKPKVKGRFKYTVISSENPQLRLDPDIIVEDPPTEPHP